MIRRGWNPIQQSNHRADKYTDEELACWRLSRGRTHSLIGCASLWPLALCVIGYCKLPNVTSTVRYQTLIGERRYRNEDGYTKGTARLFHLRVFICYIVVASDAIQLAYGAAVGGITSCFKSVYSVLSTASAYYTRSRAFTSHLGEPGSIPGGVTLELSHCRELCRTMPLVGRFSRGSPVSPVPVFRRRPILTSLHLIGSQDIDAKRRPDLPSPLAVSHTPLRGTPGTALQARAQRRVAQHASYLPYFALGCTTLHCLPPDSSTARIGCYTLHYITLTCISLHHTALGCTTLLYPEMLCTRLHCPSPDYTTLHSGNLVPYLVVRSHNPAEALPAEALPAEGLPAEALPAEALTAEALTAEALPADALPAEALTAEALPADLSLHRQHTVTFTLHGGECSASCGIFPRLRQIPARPPSCNYSSVSYFFFFGTTEHRPLPSALPGSSYGLIRPLSVGYDLFRPLSVGYGLFRPLSVGSKAWTTCVMSLCTGSTGRDRPGEQVSSDKATTRGVLDNLSSIKDADGGTDFALHKHPRLTLDANKEPRGSEVFPINLRHRVPVYRMLDVGKNCATNFVASTGNFRCRVAWCGVGWCDVGWCGVVWRGVVWRGVGWRGVGWGGVVWCDVCRVAWCGVGWCDVGWGGVVWCDVVWRGVAWRGVAWRGVMWCGVVWCGVVWGGVMWCGVAWRGVMWRGVVWCGVAWCGVAWRAVVWRGVVWRGMVWGGVGWRGVVWCGVMWRGVAWCGVLHDQLIGPFIFPGRLTGELYLQLLHEELPLLLEDILLSVRHMDRRRRFSPLAFLIARSITTRLLRMEMDEGYSLPKDYTPHEELLARIMPAATEIKDSRVQLRRATLVVQKRVYEKNSASLSFLVKMYANRFRRCGSSYFPRKAL
ncbi:hypothetical protein PR048_003967 [Dryococelus australis]|uniref:Uncharacterized protein n=1 Tax=Dryococelus australis TaxID=614101 RepID=A0ABQ9I454_9NEOP|nr:hypothetical protein PR048_003967 [Dryococelus australis]